jgi:hypothetical protein
LNALTSCFFTGKEEYGNQKSENPFLKALASVGFQVVVLL